MKKLISIISPVLNEEENVENFYHTMCKECDKLADKYDFEFVFTDNASTDQTYNLLHALAQKDERIRVFSFSRNFGFQNSIYTGYCKSRGDAVIEFDCDLQDPPSLLPQFLEQWEAGYQIVYGVRIKRQEGFLITFARKRFYRFLNNISDNNLPADAGDFMMIDKKIVDILRSINDQNIYIRGLIFSLGFQQKPIPYNRHARIAGTSKFSLWKLIKLALDGIVSQSEAPLRLASFVGGIIALVTLALSGFYLLSFFFFQYTLPAGFTTTVLLLLFSISLNALFLGIIGEYLARIYKQVKKAPLSVIEKKIDIYSSETIIKESPKIVEFPIKKQKDV